MIATLDGSTFRVPEAVHARRFGDELILLDLSAGEYFALDELGARIWDELAGGRDVVAIVERLAPEYDVSSERFREDLAALTDELLRRKLLIVAR